MVHLTAAAVVRRPGRTALPRLPTPEHLRQDRLNLVLGQQVGEEGLQSLGSLRERLITLQDTDCKKRRIWRGVLYHCWVRLSGI
jgi:hypothetical protein